MTSRRLLHRPQLSHARERVFPTLAGEGMQPAIMRDDRVASNFVPALLIRAGDGHEVMVRAHRGEKT